MKKFILFLLVALMLVSVSACHKTPDTDKSTSGNTKNSAQETANADESTQENNKEQIDSVDKQVKKVRQCIKCGRVIGASKYEYCDGCRCFHINGCALPRKDRSSYCITHACLEDGCTSEHDINSNYCYRHKK